MLKVIHFLPTINYTSGIASMIMNYYRKIDKSKIQFEFITFLKNNKVSFKKEIEDLGGKVYSIESPKKILKFYKGLNEILKKYKNQKVIFHNHQINFTIFIYGLVKKELNCKFIIHNHTSKYSDKILSSIRNYILCWPIKFLNVERFACSEKAAKLVYGNKKFYLMVNGIDFEKYKFDENIREKYRKEFNVENNFVIGHIGHFEKVKNHDYILKIFYEICNKDEKFVLLLVGNGKLKNEFIKKIKKLKIEKKVILLENRNDIHTLLNAMDVFVFPSKFEGLGIAAIEAQANGLPLIISNKVPKEVNITNATVLNINNSSLEIWVEQILKIYHSKNNRKKTTFINNIFSIDESCVALENKYLNMIGSDLK